jgi:hypothetical protein
MMQSAHDLRGAQSARGDQARAWTYALNIFPGLQRFLERILMLRSFQGPVGYRLF